MSEAPASTAETPERYKYVTEDGKAEFEFDLVPCEDGTYFEIDIISAPGYGVRDAATSKTHRRQSTRGGEMVCIGDYKQACPTLEDAQKWARIWADLTWKYIQTGEGFPG